MVHEEIAKVINSTKDKIKTGEGFTKEDILEVEARSNNQPDGVWSALFDKMVVRSFDLFLTPLFRGMLLVGVRDLK